MPVTMPARTGKRRPRDTKREWVVMEWVLAEGNIGLSLEFYLAKSAQDATDLRERLMALRLPEGAAERTVTLRAPLPWPRTDDELQARLEGQDTQVRGLLATRAAIDTGADDDG